MIAEFERTLQWLLRPSKRSKGTGKKGGRRMAGGGKITTGAIDVAVDSMLGRAILRALSVEPKHVRRLLTVGLPGKPDLEVYVLMQVRMQAVTTDQLDAEATYKRSLETARL